MLPLLSYQLPFFGKNGRFCRFLAIHSSVNALRMTINKNKLMGRWHGLLCFLSVISHQLSASEGKRQEAPKKNLAILLPKNKVRN